VVANQVEDGQFEGLKFWAGVNTQSHALGFVESQGDRGVAAVAPNPGLGLPTSTVVEAFDCGPLISAWESDKLSRIARGAFSAEFALALALKHVHLALSEGGPEHFKVLAALAKEWEDIADRGLGSEDVTVVTRTLSE
jgi:3-hydroxyisobutyrate dehydrogenase